MDSNRHLPKIKIIMEGLDKIIKELLIALLFVYFLLSVTSG